MFNLDISLFQFFYSGLYIVVNTNKKNFLSFFLSFLLKNEKYYFTFVVLYKTIEIFQGSDL